MTYIPVKCHLNTKLLIYYKSLQTLYQQAMSLYKLKLEPFWNTGLI